MKLNPAMGLAIYTHLEKWQPQIGDIILFTGLVTKWVGIVGSYANGEVEVIKHGLPCELVTMGPNEQKKNTLKLDVSEIQRSPRGKYAVLGEKDGQQVWYIN